MANPSENFVLVEMQFGKPNPAMNALAKQPVNSVVRIVRSYLSMSRAQQDHELLKETNPDKEYHIETVLHIDD